MEVWVFGSPDTDRFLMDPDQESFSNLTVGPILYRLRLANPMIVFERNFVSHKLIVSFELLTKRLESVCILTIT